jgi:hypothetical protein
MAYDETPLEVSRWADVFKTQRAKKLGKAMEIVLASLNLNAAAARSARLVRSKGRVDVLAKASSFGRRAFPPRVRAVDSRRIRPVDFKEPEGLRPRHLDFRPIPPKLPKALEQPNRVRPFDLRVEGEMALIRFLSTNSTRTAIPDCDRKWSVQLMAKLSASRSSKGMSTKTTST